MRCRSQVSGVPMLGFIQANKTEVDFMKTCIICVVLGTCENKDQPRSLFCIIHEICVKKRKICSDMHCVDMS